MMPQPNPWGISGGCRAAWGMDISELFRIPDVHIRLLLFPGVSDLLKSQEHISPAANAVRCTLDFFR